MDTRLRLKAPSISVRGGKKGDTIYMRGVLEENFKVNLDTPLAELFSSGATLTVTDPSIPYSVKVVVEFMATIE